MQMSRFEYIIVQHTKNQEDNQNDSDVRIVVKILKEPS